MTDELIKRVAEGIDAETGAYGLVGWGGLEIAARRGLETLRPGDVLPNGCMVVPLEPNPKMYEAVGPYYLTYDRRLEYIYRTMTQASKGDN